MIEIKSKIQPETTLHIIHRLADSRHHLSLIPDNEFLQCLIIQKDVGTKFTPHSHLYNPITPYEQLAQEAWSVVKGSIRCFYYDLDDSPLGSEVLYAGDVNITLYGGHTFEILEKDTLVYEFKNGPYYGKGRDKRTLQGDVND